MATQKLYLVDYKRTYLGTSPGLPDYNLAISNNLDHLGALADHTYLYHYILINISGATAGQNIIFYVQRESQSPVDATANLTEPGHDRIVYNMTVPPTGFVNHLIQIQPSDDNPSGGDYSAMTRFQVWALASNFSGTGTCDCTIYTLDSFSGAPAADLEVLSTLPTTLMDYNIQADTVANFIAEVRPRIQDVTDLSVSDATIIDYINDGLKQIAIGTGIFQAGEQYTLSSVSTSDWQHTFDLSKSSLTGILTYEFIQVRSVHHNLIKLDFAPRGHIFPSAVQGAWSPTNNNTASGTPSAWTTVGKNLMLDYGIKGGDIVDIYYSYVPDPVSATTDNIPSSKYIWTVLKPYVIYRILESDREGGQANRMYQEYNNLLKSLANIADDAIGAGAAQ